MEEKQMNNEQNNKFYGTTEAAQIRRRRRRAERRRQLYILKGLCIILAMLVVVTIIHSTINTANAKEVAMAASTVSLDSEDVGYRKYVPMMAGSRKTYSDYTLITAQSVQKVLQRNAWTDENGFRRYGTEGYYMVVMGSYYGKAGDIIRIQMKNGYTFDAIIGDVKSDEGTDGWNMYSGLGNLLSFLVDTDAISEECVAHGDMSYASPLFKGEVGKIYEVNTEA
jgi:hypothetical protein